jgi:hypothetical protein
MKRRPNLTQRRKRKRDRTSRKKAQKAQKKDRTRPKTVVSGLTGEARGSDTDLWLLLLSHFLRFLCLFAAILSSLF